MLLPSLPEDENGENHLQQAEESVYSVSAGYVLKLLRISFLAGLNERERARERERERERERKSCVISDLTNSSSRLEKRLLTRCAGLSLFIGGAVVSSTLSLSAAEKKDVPPN